MLRKHNVPRRIWGQLLRELVPYQKGARAVIAFAMSVNILTLLTHKLHSRMQMVRSFGVCLSTPMARKSRQ